MTRTLQVNRGEKPTAVLYVRPPPGLKRALVLEAERRGISVNELVNLALRQVVATDLGRDT